MGIELLNCRGQTLQEKGRKGDPYTQGPFTSPYLKFQEMAVLVITPLSHSPAGAPLSAPAQIKVNFIPHPDPPKSLQLIHPVSGWAPKPVLALRTHILALSHEWFTVALRSLPSQPGHQEAGCCRLLGEGSWLGR